MHCAVCDGRDFSDRKILWQGLIDEWQISTAEVAYVNQQQGTSCNRCGANLRSAALAKAILSAGNFSGTLREFVTASDAARLSILEINEAGSLTPTLKQFPKYTFGAYPEVDIHAIPFAAETFDVVVHSDTLEHVDNPIHALEECRRVLKPGGSLCFTVPIIVGRMTRNRTGLPASYHGDPETATDDLRVVHEFGADAWTYVMEAGFSKLTFHSVGYPAAVAMQAIK